MLSVILSTAAESPNLLEKTREQKMFLGLAKAEETFNGRKQAGGFLDARLR